MKTLGNSKLSDKTLTRDSSGPQNDVSMSAEEFKIINDSVRPNNEPRKLNFRTAGKMIKELLGGGNNK